MTSSQTGASTPWGNSVRLDLIMTNTAQSLFTPRDAALQSVRDNAGQADRGHTTLRQDMQTLHEAGILADVTQLTSVGGDALAGADILRQIGRANLAMGRIIEGHANAIRLIDLYGSVALRERAHAQAQAGQWFGVWGADGRRRVSATDDGAGIAVLDGERDFCSGLGLIAHALLPVNTPDGVVLYLADVTDPARADLSAWNVSGMRATASGRFDLDGLQAEPVGQPGDYTREPHFEGGIWRYCAVQTGGLEAIAQLVRQHIRLRGQDGDPHQIQRLAQVVIHAQTARMWVDAACQMIESGTDTDAALALVLLAREAVEQACLASVAIGERVMGTAAFRETGDMDRVRRDLAFYLRQANLDGKRAEAARLIIASDAVVGDMW